MSHTPGPWRLEGEGIKAMVRGDDATIVALRHRLPGPVNDANMRLIAAAPDLLAFAESVVTLFAKEYPQAGLHLDMDKASLLNAAREVIKKARGQ